MKPLPASRPARKSLDRDSRRRASAVALGALASAWLVGAAPHPAPSGPLYPRPFFTVGEQALGIASADFDGDGLPDLVVGARQYHDGCAAVLLAGADTVLRQAGCLPVGGDPVAFAVADFDGDRHADIAAGWQPLDATSIGGILVYLGNGDGTFREGDRITVGVVGSLAAGDFDGDGLPDLAVARLATATDDPYAAVVRGSGDGTFGPVEPFAAAQVVLVATDLDGDGLSDVVTADWSHDAVTVYLGSASGTPAAKVTYDVGQVPHSLAVADFDGDGHSDVGVGFAQGQQVRILLGRGNGFLTAQPPVSLGEAAGPLAAADFDGDGHPDVAVARLAAPGVILLAGDGRGTLRQGGLADVAAGTLVAADFDGDGLPDLATTSGTGVALLRAFGDYSFAGNLTVSSGTPLRGATAGDFNRDGRDDLAVFYYATGEIHVYLGRGDGTFLNPIVLGTDNQPQQLLATGDFNGDGNLDLASIGYGRVVILPGNGRGGFAPPRTTTIPDFAITNAAAGDLDGDGRDDVVVVGQANTADVTGYAVVLLAGPDGTLRQGTYWEAGQKPLGAAIGDLDGNGTADLAVVNRVSQGGNPAGALTVLSGFGNGTFGPPATFALDGPAEGIVAADLNADAVIDLAIAETTTTDIPAGALSVLIGAGGGVFAPERHYAATRAPSIVLAHDVDADGVLDLVTVDTGVGDIAVLRGDGPGAFAPREHYAAGPSCQSLAAGDFDGDGRADIALTNQNTSFNDGLFVVLPSRPPFPCLPLPTDEPGHCAENVTDARLTSAATAGRGAALVTWRTTHEYDVTGFNLVQVDNSGHLLRLNQAPIPCVQCSGGEAGSYAYPLAHSTGSRDLFVQRLSRSEPPRLFGPVLKH